MQWFLSIPGEPLVAVGRAELTRSADSTKIHHLWIVYHSTSGFRVMYKEMHFPNRCCEVGSNCTKRRVRLCIIATSLSSILCVVCYASTRSCLFERCPCHNGLPKTTAVFSQQRLRTSLSHPSTSPRSPSQPAWCCRPFISLTAQE